MMLCEVGHVDMHAESTFTRIRLEDSGEELQQRRLPGTVRSDESDLVTAIEREVECLVDDVVVVGLPHAAE